MKYQFPANSIWFPSCAVTTDVPIPKELVETIDCELFEVIKIVDFAIMKAIEESKHPP